MNYALCLRVYASASFWSEFIPIAIFRFFIVVLIFVGNSGVGLEAAVGLAKRGANVVIACRNEERAKVCSPSLN